MSCNTSLLTVRWSCNIPHRLIDVEGTYLINSSALTTFRLLSLLYTKLCVPNFAAASSANFWHALRSAIVYATLVYMTYKTSPQSTEFTIEPFDAYCFWLNRMVWLGSSESADDWRVVPCYLQYRALCFHSMISVIRYISVLFRLRLLIMRGLVWIEARLRGMLGLAALWCLISDDLWWTEWDM